MFQKLLIRVLASALTLLLFGCATLDSGTTTPQGFSYNRPGGLSQAKDLSPGDGIEVSVEVDGVMEVSAHPAEINRRGMVTLPLVGDVKVGGMTVSEARDAIAETYGAYYVNPPVVMLKLVGDEDGGEWGYVTVLGRVNKPGRIPLQSPAGINLSAAIQLADGFAPSAKTSSIRVTRTDELGMQTRVSVDFEQIGEAGNVDADLLLQEDDIVYVPERIF